MSDVNQGSNKEGSGSATAILIPVYNGEGTIGEVIRRCAPLELPIIAVDDGSRDGTLDRLKQLEGVRWIRHEENLGKGRALQSGFRFALAEGYEAVVTMDADGQHLPEEVPKFLKRFREAPVDLLVGNRLGDKSYLRKMPWHRAASNRVSSSVIRRAGGLKIRDVQCGFRLYRLEPVCRMQKVFRRRGFEFETAVLLEAQARGLKLDNVPIHCEYPEGTVKSQYRPLGDSWRIGQVVLDYFMHGKED
jgi:glycosyltransferase involved in cell wall biosynthesis